MSSKTSKTVAPVTASVAAPVTAPASVDTSVVTVVYDGCVASDLDAFLTAASLPFVKSHSLANGEVTMQVVKPEGGVHTHARISYGQKDYDNVGKYLAGLSAYYGTDLADRLSGRTRDQQWSIISGACKGRIDESMALVSPKIGVSIQAKYLLGLLTRGGRTTGVKSNVPVKAF